MDNDRDIIRYLDGEMLGDELLEFENRMEQDSGLGRLVEEIRSLQDVARKSIGYEGDPEQELDEDIRNEIRSLVREFKEKMNEGGGLDDKKSSGYISDQLQDVAAGYFHKSPGKPRKSQLAWYSIAAVLVVGGILSVILLRPFSKLSTSEIYNNYAGIYNKSESILELTRSDDDFLFAVEVFESRDYERAVILFQMLADSIPIRDHALLYLGHSYLGLNLTDMAASSYQQVMESSNLTLLDDAKWYLSLCYLKKDMPDKATELLYEISDSDSPYKRDSKEILRRIN